MNPVVRMVGKVLRLVGISSREDSAPRPKSTSGPPDWRDAAGRKPKEYGAALEPPENSLGTDSDPQG